jgi:hypothetical protein
MDWFQYLQVHGDCITIKTRFRPVPLRWAFCYRAPKQGAVLDDLMVPVRGQKQQESGNGSSSSMIGRLNPQLKLEGWVDEEIRYWKQQDGD